MGDKGFALAELFGYHFSLKIKETVAAMGLKKNLIRVNFADYMALMSENWLDMGQYHLFLPLLFSILKENNDTVSLRTIDQYL